MNKKLFLLPFLAVSLLVVGCTGAQTNPSGGEQSQQGGGEGSGSQGQKEIWEEDEVEGESTIAQVKAGEAGQYYTVRGTVVANAGSTLAIYRKGQFLYCYNFKAEAHENLVDHPLGAYVEIHAQSSAYSGSVQLTAYDVGEQKTDAKYDLAASLKVLAAKGEEVAPVVVSEAAQLTNAAAAGMLMKAEFVSLADATLKADTKNNQDVKGKIGDNNFTLRMDKYVPEDVQAALVEANGAEILDHATYEVVCLGAATSDGVVRGILCEGASWRKTKDASFDDPTAVVLDSTENEVEAGKTLALDWAVEPETAKQAVTFTSSDEDVATVDEAGVVTGVAPGPVTITAAAVAKPEVTGTFALTVVAPAAAPLTEAVTLDFSARTETGTWLDSITGKTVTEVIQDAAGTGSAHVVNATSSSVSSGNGSGGAYPNSAGFLKFGTGSKDGTLTIEFDGLVNKVEISCHDWYKKNESNQTNSNTFAVNGSETQLMPYNEEGTAGTLTFNLATPSDTIALVSHYRGFVWTITYSYVAA